MFRWSLSSVVNCFRGILLRAGWALMGTAEVLFVTAWEKSLCGKVTVGESQGVKGLLCARLRARCRDWG